MPQAVLDGLLVLTLPEDAQKQGGLFLVRRRQDGDPLGRLEDEERRQDRLGASERRDLREIALQDHQRLRVRVPESPDLFEETLPDHRVEEIGERLSLDPDGPQDIVSRRDLLHLDVDAEFAEPLGNVPRLIRIDNERNAHAVSNRRGDVNVPVTAANQRR